MSAATSPKSNVTVSSPWVHRVAWVLCAVTFPLLWVGGLVTTTKAGMAVPDWPGTYGYNLFLYPWQSWFFGPWDLFIEHGHRLLASLAGLLTIVLAALLWRYDARRWMRVVGLVALAGVIAQGVLGGLRVVLSDRLLAMVHGSTGPLFFILTVAIVVWTSRGWLEKTQRDESKPHKLVPIALAGTLLVYMQMIAGAVLRHMLVSASPQTFRTAVVVHLALALIVLAASLEIAWLATRSGQIRHVRLAGLAVLLVVLVQLSLGVATWLVKYGTPVWAESMFGSPTTAIVADGWWQTHLITAHQATGSLLLATLLTATLWSWRTTSATAKLQTSVAAEKSSGASSMARAAT